MADAFTLRIPVADAYRSLVPDLVNRYAELSGGSSGAAAALAEAVAAAVDRIASGMGPGASVDLSFEPGAGGMHVELSCDGRREAVNVAMPVARR